MLILVILLRTVAFIAIHNSRLVCTSSISQSKATSRSTQGTATETVEGFSLGNRGRSFFFGRGVGCADEHDAGGDEEYVTREASGIVMFPNVVVGGVCEIPLIDISLNTSAVDTVDPVKDLSTDEEAPMYSN